MKHNIPAAAADMRKADGASGLLEKSCVFNRGGGLGTATVLLSPYRDLLTCLFVGAKADFAAGCDIWVFVSTSSYLKENLFMAICPVSS